MTTTSDQLRDCVLQRIASLGITRGRAAALADLPDQTVRDYLDGRSDLSVRRTLALLTALGLDISLRTAKKYAVPPK